MSDGWTDRAPARGGWYWFARRSRFATDPSGVLAPVLSYVGPDEDDPGPELMLWFSGDFIPDGEVRQFPGRWFGPIEPPPGWGG